MVQHRSPRGVESRGIVTIVRTLHSRRHWQRVVRNLHPEHDWLEISTIVFGLEFPWEVQRATELALFRTFAVPEIGTLLAQSGAFTSATQKRFSDTAIILDGAGAFISKETTNPIAIRRLNHMHGAYNIPNDQMVYVLTTFIVPAVRWIQRYGYRTLSKKEIDATVRYWQRMAELMGVKDVPTDFEGFEDFMDSYERERFGESVGGTAVTEATLALIATWYPAPLRPFVRSATLALLDPHIREALGLPEPPPLTAAMVRGSLAIRRFIIRMLPARGTPVRAAKNRRVRGYPDGWDLAQVGTFPERTRDFA